MKRVLGIRDWVLGVALVVALVVTGCGRPLDRLPSATLGTGGVTVEVNGGFEGGWGRWTSYWTPEGGPYHTEFGEIFTPEGWVTWWREGFPCSGTADWVTGRPEVKVISGPDPARIRSGKQAVQWFTFWRCHEGGLYQRIPAVPGKVYSARAFGHSWYSRCSLKPHSPPLDDDCKTPIDWAHDWLSVGIDPTGGVDPLAKSVVWGEEREIYGRYDEQGLEVRGVVAEGEWVTVFLRAMATHPLKHNDVYWDDAEVWGYHAVYLPLIMEGVGSKE
jgi:hypothetical protein